MSAQPCGCDLECKTGPYYCQRHRPIDTADAPYIYAHKGGGMSTEIRHTDPTTGGQKGVKLARFSLVPWDAVWKVAEHFGVGARKYEDRNWERGYAWHLSYDALMRHLTAWWHGEDRD